MAALQVDKENALTGNSEETTSPREVALVDLDCFHCQVMTKDRTDLHGKPVVVINRMKKILAVNYVAREFGVKRSDGLGSARKKCQELVFVEVPSRWDKPDQRQTRLASYEIFDCIKEFFEIHQFGNAKIHYSSQDEFYVDLTDIVTEIAHTKTAMDFFKKTFLEGFKKISRNNCDEFKGVVQNISITQPEEFRLLHAAVIIGQLLNFVLSKTGYQASAGIAHNKHYAKLACGLNKPESVTVFLNDGLLRLSKEIELKKIPKLGGKKGEAITNEFRNDAGQPVTTIFDLQQTSTQALIERFGERDGTEFSRLAHGIDPSVVENKFFRASVTCGRKIQPKINSLAELKIIMEYTSEELFERLEEERFRNKRRPSRIRIKVSRRINFAEGQRPKIESGSFQCQQILENKDDLFENSMMVLENNWEKNGQDPFDEITAINFIAAGFVPLME